MRAIVHLPASRCLPASAVSFESGRGGNGLPVPGRRPAAFGLTEREQETVEFLARGYSNQEIASELFIAVRTAEGHVANVLTKLGLRSRSQVAAWQLGKRRLETAV